uniref:Uncharacterized protein n=1 Tax=Anguilla anguilla TaxID=7936 RepID=A0A0E9W582_ANGAN
MDSTEPCQGSLPNPVSRYSGCFFLSWFSLSFALDLFITFIYFIIYLLSCWLMLCCSPVV